MHSHPLAEIRFHRLASVDGEETYFEETVHWYHVPRLGDRVLVGDPETSNFVGPVTDIIWREMEGVVDIRLG